MLIILVGMPACGKTTIGKTLARRLAYKHIDLDLYITQRIKSSPEALINNISEPYFRSIEETCFNILVKENNNKNLVLSLGGGAFCNPRINSKCRQLGITFWINTKISVIKKRMQFSKVDRPIFKVYDSKKKLKELNKKRSYFYEKSNFKIKLKKETPFKASSKIIKILDKINAK